MHKQKDQGFVSIFSILIIMSILSLILVGFSTITRQAQKRTLDDQLSTQAFYAAESGVNDAQAYIKANPLVSVSKPDCTTGGGSSFGYTIDPTLNVGYSCVLIDPNPFDIRYSTVGVEGSTDTRIITLASKDGDNIDRFTVNWDSNATASLPTDSSVTFPSRASNEWGTKVGMLRMDIVPKGASNGLDRASLIRNTYTLFLYPTASSSGTSTLYTARNGGDNQGATVLVRCNQTTGLRCKLDVRLSPVSGGASNNYTLRLSSIYNPVQVTVNNVLNPGGTTLKLKEGQYSVDSTGKANDVFRRIQVRIPYEQTGAASYSSFAIQSGDSICKRLQVKTDGTLVETGDILPTSAAASCSIDTDPL